MPHGSAVAFVDSLIAAVHRQHQTIWHTAQGLDGSEPWVDSLDGQPTVMLQCFAIMLVYCYNLLSGDIQGQPKSRKTVSSSGHSISVPPWSVTPP